MTRTQAAQAHPGEFTIGVQCMVAVIVEVKFIFDPNAIHTISQGAVLSGGGFRLVDGSLTNGVADFPLNPAMQTNEFFLFDADVHNGDPYTVNAKSSDARVQVLKGTVGP
jgi:hypothetical protein